MSQKRKTLESQNVWGKIFSKSMKKAKRDMSKTNDLDLKIKTEFDESINRKVRKGSTDWGNLVDEILADEINKLDTTELGYWRSFYPSQFNSNSFYSNDCFNLHNDIKEEQYDGDTFYVNNINQSFSEPPSFYQFQKKERSNSLPWFFDQNNKKLLSNFV